MPSLRTAPAGGSISNFESPQDGQTKSTSAVPANAGFIVAPQRWHGGAGIAAVSTGSRSGVNSAMANQHHAPWPVSPELLILMRAKLAPIFRFVRGMPASNRVPANGDRIVQTAKRLRADVFAAQSWAEAIRQRSTQIVRESQACMKAALHTLRRMSDLRDERRRKARDREFAPQPDTVPR